MKKYPSLLIYDRSDITKLIQDRIKSLGLDIEFDGNYYIFNNSIDQADKIVEELEIYKKELLNDEV